MSVTIEVIPDPHEGGFTARLHDIPAYGEGDTEDEAIDVLKEAIRGYIETFGLRKNFMEEKPGPAGRMPAWPDYRA